MYAVVPSALHCTKQASKQDVTIGLPSDVRVHATETRHWSRAPSHRSTRPSRKLTACSVSVRLSAFLWPSLAELPQGTAKYGRGEDKTARPAIAHRLIGADRRKHVRVNQPARANEKERKGKERKRNVTDKSPGDQRRAASTPLSPRLVGTRRGRQTERAPPLSRNRGARYAPPPRPAPSRAVLRCLRACVHVCVHV